MVKKNIISLQDEMFIEIWRMLFKERFGFNVDVSKILIRKKSNTYKMRGLPLVMPQQLAQGKVGLVERLFRVCEETVPNRQIVNVKSRLAITDEPDVQHDRTPKNGSYFIIVGSHHEAINGDFGLKDLSAKKIWEQGRYDCPTATLPERLMLEVYLWYTTGCEIDQLSETLCTGSRFVNGRPGVPTVKSQVGLTMIMERHITDFGGPYRARLVGVDEDSEIGCHCIMPFY